ncbi:tRNA (adenosine(37)-N6)-threonylcarbamoyltransferase complex dimerization subunit type 1 TsaB [Tautonia sociabilis]|uniref:tRNA (Adenosine(37)-N6)-threonylcarbamoyltransferase complex dimerization subunit type 1 TsaB n=1 Tax=Tautonia sociabilis TaxID=2080755 RepID=A0A432MDS0_9BACT|nr:tRNA (adenosine(37)-N6)-threonylcarbamoyltransferase complex dimerization subunit type 1 TsaB [Tautonia sociabilis]RUL83087.1 tRNA (adenosine(37)-N6)-threonylcarbamoyltransferase complex dimerization subunit type 1 TsaB [Tautonia sociabilis]
MILLALDTATLRPAVALAAGDGRWETAYPEPGPRHGRLLVPTIQGLLHRVGLRASDLEAVAVGLGPGSFTGLRVGVTAAKALAYAVGCPVVGLSSLEALARGAPASDRAVEVAVDAQRGDLFAASFSRGAPGAPLLREGPDRIVPASSWAAGLPEGARVVCPTPDRVSGLLPPWVRLDRDDRGGPDGIVLLAMAEEAVAEGRFADPWTLEPVYLRRSAAEEKADAPRG